MKKVLLVPGITALLLLSACGSNTANIIDNGTSSSSVGTTDTTGTASSIDSSSSADTGTVGSGTASSTNTSVTATDTRVIDMTVTDWAFSPTAITVKKGEKVVVRLTGIEGDHSMFSQDLGINTPVNAGETVDITIPTDKAGTFAFKCGIPCGPGHKTMVGQIIVTEA
ncbi:MAG: cytochrome c oxidase subunit [Candidatus Peribacteria bacterium]|nr:cytochrome c oxidase subunit [Candidatus Peribacteria bacterium]